MNKILLAGSLVCSIALAGSGAVPGQETTWKYSEENMKNTYAGKWSDSISGFQIFLPTEGWEEYVPGSESEETESEGDYETLGAETEAETEIGTETEAETAAGTETEAETAAGTETEAETAAGIETEAEAAADAETEAETAEGTETEAETEEPADAGTTEYALIQPEDKIIVNLYHLESEDESYPSLDDIKEMFGEYTNVYLVECNGIRAVHFDAGDTENLAFPEIVGDKDSGFIGSTAVLSVKSSDREDRELFADELFSSVRIKSDDSTVYLKNGQIFSDEYAFWQIQEASELYVRMLSHKRFISNEEEDESGLATGFALIDLDDDGIMELLVQYAGTNPEAEYPVTDYALYTCADAEEKLLQTMEGLGEDDMLYYFPSLRILEYDTYFYDEDYEDEEYHYDCYQYDGDRVIYSDYYDIDWSGGDAELCLSAPDFIIPNTEENQQSIAERMQENMEEHMGER